MSDRLQTVHSISKTANNERLKLRATFFNNMAVGFGISGFLVPAISIMPQVPAFLDAAPVSHSTAIGLSLSLAGMFIAFLACFTLRRTADSEIQMLED